MPVGYTCPRTVVGQNASRLCLSAHDSREKCQSVILVRIHDKPNAGRLYLSAYMINQMPVGYTCPRAIVGQNACLLYLSARDSRKNASRLCLSAHDSRAKCQSVILVRIHDRPNASRLYLSARDSRTKFQSVILVRTHDRPNASRFYLSTRDSRKNASRLCLSAHESRTKYLSVILVRAR
jgi:putative heme iron utilization protein